MADRSVQEISEKQSTAELGQVLPELLHQAGKRMTNPALTGSWLARNCLGAIACKFFLKYPDEAHVFGNTNVVDAP
jgi:hypothetical protein